jgi:hypothetical protein
VELTAALGRDWADVLEGLSQDAIQKAAIQYQRNEPRRKPTPAAIYALAKEFMPRPVAVPKDEWKPVENLAPPDVVADIVGSFVKRFGGGA